MGGQLKIITHGRDDDTCPGWVGSSLNDLFLSLVLTLSLLRSPHAVPHFLYGDLPDFIYWSSVLSRASLDSFAFFFLFGACNPPHMTICYIPPLCIRIPGEVSFPYNFLPTSLGSGAFYYTQSRRLMDYFIRTPNHFYLACIQFVICLSSFTLDHFFAPFLLIKNCMLGSYGPSSFPPLVIVSYCT
jgi:hypothetical protein